MKARTKCFVCNTKTKRIFTLGNIAVSDFTKKQTTGDLVPLEMAQCCNKECGLAQLRHVAPEMYKYYWYQSGLNKKIIDDLKEIAHVGAKHRQGVWLDIGSNDGTLLSFVPKRFVRIGVDPASNLAVKCKQHADKVFIKTWEKADAPLADVITAIGMFYDSPDPNLFIKKVKERLQENGVFIAQMMTLKQMIEKNDVGNICHEHLEYYDYKALKYLYESNGLEIYKVEENDINGGSYRIFARHYSTGSVKHKEKSVNWKKFYDTIMKNIRKTADFVNKEQEKGKYVYGYGASTKGNTILQLLGVDLEGIAEIHPEKINKYTVRSAITIVHEDEARELADYFLVFPYSFKKGFLKREANWRKKGGKFIFITPNFQVI